MFPVPRRHICYVLAFLLSSVLSFSAQSSTFGRQPRRRPRCKAGQNAVMMTSPATATPEAPKMTKPVKDLTLVFCRRRRIPKKAGEGGEDGDDGGEILLGMKKRGFGEGKWNGFGGKVESGETVEQAAKRELVEEAGVTANELSLRGKLIFHVPSYPSTMRVHVYEATSYDGDPEESEEMRPQWFRVTELPLKRMWADDEYWMPLFLKGKCFRGEFNFSDEQTIVEHVLHTVAPGEVL